MKLVPQIVFRNIDESETAVDAIHKHAERLERFFPKLIGCRVVVESPHNHRAKHYQVNIKLTVPGRDLVINLDQGKNDSHCDLYVAVRDAFDVATRQLEDYARLRRGDVKNHVSREHVTPDADRATL